MNLTRLAAIAAISLASISAFATVYNDAIGDIAASIGSQPHLDITSVVVTNTATDITFDISLNGSPIATQWGKYLVFMSTPGSTGDTSVKGNAWTYNISLSGGANKYIGGWADQPTSNAQLWTYSGSWSQNSTFTSTITSTSISYTVALSSLGLSAGDILKFDVATTGGNTSNGAVDSLTTGAASWDDPTVLTGERYVVQAVPEPTSMAALALGVVVALRRRRTARL